ncbi:MAG: hypothetical protein J6S71_01975 [Clostridia bacterium]|nr:hypothetical protein [Clostridia bacterium]
MIHLIPESKELLLKILEKHAPHLIEHAFDKSLYEYTDYSREDYIALTLAVSNEFHAAGLREDLEPNEYGLRCEELIDEIMAFVFLLERPPMKGVQKIQHRVDIIAFYEATNSLHDGMIAFTDLCGDTLRIGVDVTSIIGHPRVEMIFRGVKDWHIKNDDCIFCSNIAFENGKIIWANADRLDMEILKRSTYVRADSMEWVM